VHLGAFSILARPALAGTVPSVSDTWRRGLAGVGILLAGVVASLAVRFDQWTWLRAVAAGIATMAILVAAYFNSEQARQAREQALAADRQVEAAKEALAHAQQEAEARSNEAAAAAALSRRTFEETVKSRLDALAPIVTISLHLQISVGQGSARRTYVGDFKNLLDVPDPKTAIHLLLTFEALNHGAVSLPFFVPTNPLPLAEGYNVGRGEGWSVLEPGNAYSLSYEVYSPIAAMGGSRKRA
jgi:hypothetical protein